MHTEGSMDNVTVLMSTYNGEKYINEQLESIINQKGVNQSILIRDDGSSDATVNILKQYEEKKVLSFYCGENVRPARSFLDLLKHAPDTTYYAFSDQDDYWLDDKLQIAVEKMKRYSNRLPILYCGRPRIVDQNLKYLVPLDSRTPSIHPTSFEARLVVRNTPGCTFVMNRELVEIVNAITPSYLEMHDCWIYQVCSLVGGIIIYDDDVHILYRQHGQNVAGVSISFLDRLKDHVNRFRSGNCDRSKTAAELLRCFGDNLSEEKATALRMLSEYKKSVPNRIKLITSSKFNTESKKFNMNFKLSVLLGVF